jgi:hypothetical protein
MEQEMITPEQFKHLSDTKKLDIIFDRLEKLKPIGEAYDSFIFGRKVAVGVVGVMATLASIGGGILWLFTHFAFHR